MIESERGERVRGEGEKDRGGGDVEEGIPFPRIPPPGQEGGEGKGGLE